MQNYFFNVLKVFIPKRVRTFIKNTLKHIPFNSYYRKAKWTRQYYTKFSKDQRKFIFQSIAKFCHINRPIDGYYFEFGSHEANTFRMAWDCSKYLFNWTYVAFDSFEGLPEIGEVDRQVIWERGKLKTEEEKFVKIVTKYGMPKDRIVTVKGFYNDTLTDKLKNRFLPKKAAVIYIDCDLYESTVPVLNFIYDFLQIGTIIVFDDWNCFYGDPDKGERRAFREFRRRQPELKFEEFVRTNEAMSFIFLGKDL